MKIAIPCNDNNGLESEISMHFGRSPYYTFISVGNNKIEKVEVIPVPFAEHGPGDLPNFVKENNGEVVIAYGMGGRAVDFFNQLGIRVITGAQGKVKDAVDAFLKNNLEIDKDWKSKEDFGHHESSSH
ncbi:MAG: dinitrogenase iron-molybdenum cofactor [Candidatus Asgardarchaeum californiense]|nr:MAG: dinitrogenase iron-molybdenum cofactor [Candidatus Asgardarchaeum californiense]